MPRPRKHDNATDYKRHFNEQTYDRISVTIPKGRKQAVEAYAKSQGGTVNGLINDLLRREIGLSESEWKARAEAEPGQTEEV